MDEGQRSGGSDSSGTGRLPPAAKPEHEPVDPDASHTHLGPVGAWWDQHWHALVERIAPTRAEDHPSRWRRAWLLTVFTLRRFLVEDRGAGMAATLTIQTLLSTVPIIAVALLVVGLMDERSGATLMLRMAEAVFPDGERAHAMAEEALRLAANVTVGNLGWWGFGAVLLIAFALFSTLERTVNRIWRVTRRRNIIVKFTMFYTLATLGPVLILFSVAQPFVAGVTRTVSVPVLTTGLGLILVNRYMPNTRVRWRPALIGGLVAAVAIEVSKLGFGYYATRFALRTYEGVYGSLAMLPILVVWSYLSWTVILLGAEIAVVVQRREVIALQHYLNRYVLDRTQMQSDSGRTAARLLLAIADRWARKSKSTSHEQLGLRFRLPLDRVGEILDELVRQGMLLEAEGEGQGYVPARPLDQLRVEDVLVAFDRERTRLPRADRLGGLFGELDVAQRRIVGHETYADLLARPRVGRGRAGPPPHAAAHAEPASAEDSMTRAPVVTDGDATAGNVTQLRER